jgi:sortase A
MKRSITRFDLGLTAVLLLGIGFWQVGAAGYIHAKAWLAQDLLDHAWQRTLAGERRVKAWPWADTWPVAEIEVPRLHVKEIVLADAGGEALAFGPAHVAGTARPGEEGTTVIAGHRDTHFKWLGDIEPGDTIILTSPNGRRHVYEVSDGKVVMAHASGLYADEDQHELALVTCWPLNAIRPGGEERYVVMATEVGGI